MSDQIAITLPDGSERALPVGSTAGDLAAAIGPRLAKAAVIASVNGTERDLDWVLADGDDVAVIVEESDRGLYTLRHSTAHVLAQAVLDEFPGATFAIGPADRRRLLLRLRPARRRDLHPRRPRAPRRPHAGHHRRAPALRARRDPRGRGARAVPRPPVQDRDHPGPGRRPDVGHRDRAGAHLRQPATLHRPVPRPPRAPHRSAGSLQADAGGRRLLARRRAEPDAAAHLRHGLGLEEGPGRLPRAAGRGRASATTASWAPSSTCSRSPTRSARAWPCSIPRAASSAASWRTTAGSATSGPATSSSTRPTSPSRTCSRRPDTWTGSPRACSRCRPGGLR